MRPSLSKEQRPTLHPGEDDPRKSSKNDGTLAHTQETATHSEPNEEGTRERVVGPSENRCDWSTGKQGDPERIRHEKPGRWRGSYESFEFK